MADTASAASRLDCNTDPPEYYYVPRGNGGGGGGDPAADATTTAIIGGGDGSDGGCGGGGGGGGGSGRAGPRTSAVAIAPREPGVVVYGGSPPLGVSPPSLLLSCHTGSVGGVGSVGHPVAAPVRRVMSIDALDELALLRDQSVAVANRDGIWQARLGRRRVDRPCTDGSAADAPLPTAPEPCVLGDGGCDDGDLFFGAPEGAPAGLLSPFPAALPGASGGGTAGAAPVTDATVAAAALAAAAAAAVAVAVPSPAGAPVEVEAERAAAKVERGLLESLPSSSPMPPMAVPDGGVVAAASVAPAVPTAVAVLEPVSQPPTPMLSDPLVRAAGGVKRRMPTPGPSDPSAPAGCRGEGGLEAVGSADGLLTAAAVMLRKGLPVPSNGTAPVTTVPPPARGRRSSPASSSASRCGFPTASGSVRSDSGALDTLSSVPISGVASTAASSLCSSEMERSAKRSRPVGSGFAAAAAARAEASFQMAPAIAAKASGPAPRGAVRSAAAHGPATGLLGVTTTPLDAAALVDLTGTTAAESRRMTADQHALMLHKRKLRNRASAARSRDRQRASASATGCEVGRLRAEAAAAAAVATAATADATALRADNGRLRAELARVNAQLVAAQSAAAAARAAASSASAEPPVAPQPAAVTAAGAVSSGRPLAARTAAVAVGAAFAGVAAVMATGEAAMVAPTTAAQAVEAAGLLRRPSSASLLKHVSSLERMLDTHANGAGVPFGMSRSPSFLKTC
ncbi:hypothetical protein MMPV_006055 [Pyropia vietnamensis]